MLLLHFCFKLMLFGLTSHVNFHFSGCSVFTECCVYLWKRFKSSKSFLLKFPSPGKKISPSKIFHSPPTPGVQLSQGYTEPLWGDSLLFTRNSWYSLNQSWTDERLRWPWIHLVVLNFCINLVITRYKLKSQHVKLTQLWPITVNCFKVSS